MQLLMLDTSLNIGLSSTTMAIQEKYMKDDDGDVVD